MSNLRISLCQLINSLLLSLLLLNSAPLYSQSLLASDISPYPHLFQLLREMSLSADEGPLLEFFGHELSKSHLSEYAFSLSECHQVNKIKAMRIFEGLVETVEREGGNSYFNQKEKGILDFDRFLGAGPFIKCEQIESRDFSLSEIIYFFDQSGNLLIKFELGWEN